MTLATGGSASHRTPHAIVAVDNFLSLYCKQQHFITTQPKVPAQTDEKLQHFSARASPK